MASHFSHLNLAGKVHNYCSLLCKIQFPDRQDDDRKCDGAEYNRHLLHSFSVLFFHHFYLSIINYPFIKTALRRRASAPLRAIKILFSLQASAPHASHTSPAIDTAHSAYAGCSPCRGNHALHKAGSGISRCHHSP